MSINGQTTTRLFQKGLGSLGYQFSITSFWQWIIGKYSREYLLAVDTIYQDINYNNSFLFLVPGVEYYGRDAIKDILNVYGSLATAGEENGVTRLPVIHEYNPRFRDKKRVGDKNYCVAQVAKYSSQNPALVQLVLDDLFWATTDGRIQTSAFLNPNTYLIGARYRENATPRAAGYQADLKEISENVSEAGGTALKVLGVGALAFVIYKVWSAAQ